MRIAKTENGKTVSYYWDRGYIANECRPGEDAEPLYTSNYLGVDGIFARQQGESVQYLMKNGHGDVTAIVEDGAVIKTYDYDAFGTEKNIDPSDTNPIRYCGEYFDAESGQLQLRNRYYNSSIGRFMTEDPYWNVENMIYGEEDIEYKKEDFEKNYKIKNMVYLNVDQDSQNIANGMYNGNKSIMPNIEAILQSSNLYIYCIQNPIKYLDKSGYAVYAYGIGVTASFIGGYSGYYLWSTDDQGNFALMSVNNVSNAYGVTLNGIYMVFPDMPTVYEMTGKGLSIGASYGYYGGGVMYAGEYTGSYSQYSYGTGLYNLAPGMDAGYTNVIFSGNINDVAAWIKNAINKILPDEFKLK